MRKTLENLQGKIDRGLDSPVADMPPGRAWHNEAPLIFDVEGLQLSSLTAALADYPTTQISDGHPYNSLPELEKSKDIKGNNIYESPQDLQH